MDNSDINVAQPERVKLRTRSLEWHRGFGCPRFHRAPVCPVLYRVYLVISLVLVFAIHMFCVVQAIRDPQDFDGSEANVATALSLQQVYLTWWGVYGVEFFLVFALLVTYKASGDFPYAILRRILSALLLLITVLQFSIIIGFWTLVILLSDSAGAEPTLLDILKAVGTHGVVGLIHSVNFFFTGIPVYVIDITLLTVLAVVYSIVNVLYTVFVGTIYEVLDWKEAPKEAATNLVIFYGIVLGVYVAALLYKWATKAIVFGNKWRALSDKDVRRARKEGHKSGESGSLEELDIGKE